MGFDSATHHPLHFFEPVDVLFFSFFKNIWATPVTNTSDEVQSFESVHVWSKGFRKDW